MSRYYQRYLALAALISVAWIARSAPAPPAKPAAIPELAIYSRADFGGLDDPKVTLLDALDQLTSLYKIPFEVNEKAFKFEMVDDVLKRCVAETPIPPMKQGRLCDLLSRLLRRIPVNSGACIVLRREVIEITTGLFRDNEVWGASKAPHLPLVHRKFDGVPLAEALRELAELAEFNVVLDVRCAAKAKAPVSAYLLNTPLDTAVRFLADMADLQSLQQDNVLYVTSKENATALEIRFQKERDCRVKEEQANVDRRLGVGPTFFGPIQIPDK
jgi:hypothetical protein